MQLTTKKINVLSLFDGISIGLQALKELNIDCNYYSSEIKKHAIKCSEDNHKDIIRIGDVNNVSFKNGVLKTEKGDFKIGKIDLLIGGSPCQDLSFLKVGGLGLKGEKSSLFYQYIRILKESKPTYFFLENVKMKKEYSDEISALLGVDLINLNSNLVSFQNRERMYWTNIVKKENFKINPRNIDFQKYKGIGNIEESITKRTPSRERMWNNGVYDSKKRSCKNITNENNIGCITKKQDRSPNSGLIEHGDFCRFLTRRELEAGQTFPLGYTDSLSYNHAQDVIGDSWTLEIIKCFFKNLYKGSD